MSEQLDRIEEHLETQGEQLNKLTNVLGGSGMGDKGLIKQMQELKVSHYETKAEVNKLKWFASLIATGVSATVTAIVTFFKS